MDDKTLFQATTDIFTDQSLGMYYCGKRIRVQDHIYGPEIRDHYLFLLVNEGHAEMYRDGIPVYHLKKHDLLVMCPGETIYYKAKTVWSIKWIGLYGSAVEAFVNKLGVNGDDPIIKLDAYYEINELFEQVYQTAQENSIYSNFKQLSLIYSFFSLLFRERGIAEPTDYVSASKKMIAYNLNHPLTVECISADLHLNPAYFTRLFTEKEGISPKQFILEQKLQRAKSLLENTNATVHEIAVSVGFNDQLYFSRLFRKKEKMSPTEYRTIKKHN